MKTINPQKIQKFTGKNVLGIDYGTKNVGLACFLPGKDPFPTPHSNINYINDEQLLEELIKLISTEKFEIIIMGIPYLLDGQSTNMTKRIHKFGKKMQQNVPSCQLIFQDESLTSDEARNRMKNDPRYNFKVVESDIDKLSACIVIEDFFSSNS